MSVLHEQAAGLPFTSLNNEELECVCSGLRMPIGKNEKVSLIRNYIAGYTKKVLRKSRPKGLPKTAPRFVELCVELQLNVFEYLHPIDLYHISQVCKAYRKFILDPRTATVWRISFNQHPDLPRPPPGVLESDWAFMLYCPGICTVCGKYGALTDFNFLQRYCTKCMTKNYVYRDEFCFHYKYKYHSKYELAALLPYSLRRSGRYYHHTTGQRYLLKDLQLMLKKLELMRILINNGLLQFAELIQEHKNALVVHNKKWQEFTSGTGNWASDIFRKCLSECNQDRQEVMKRCRGRLHNLGYEGLNIDRALDNITSKNWTLRLTRKAFRTIKALIETLAQKRREDQIRCDRSRFLEHIYHDYAKTLSPEEWEHLPSPSRIMEIDTLKQFRDTPPFDKRGDMVPGYVSTFFPSFIEGVQKRQINRIIELFSNIESKKEIAVTEDSSELAANIESKLKIALTEDPSELAALVAYCRGELFIGWKNIFRHLMRSVEDCTSCRVKFAATVDAAMVISAAGMDPFKATVTEMDNLDTRFICRNCIPQMYQGRQSFEVYTWMQCIRHSNVKRDAMHKTSRWVCLTPAASRFVKKHKPPYHNLPYNSRYHIWGCNHCAQHYECKAAWVDVVEHVKRVHCIKVPVEGKDIRISGSKEHLRNPFYLDVEVKYHCQRCPELPICRLWKLDSLMQHLKQMHSIEEPAEGQDWSTVKMVAE